MNCYLTKINPAKNQQRFYSLHVMPDLFGQWSLIREWGRIGSGGTVKIDSYPTEDEATAKLAQFKAQKLKRGYS